MHLKALGAEVVMTRSDVGRGHPQYYQDLAEQITARDAGRLLRQPVQQPGQSAGPRNHDRRRRSGSRPISSVDAVVCGVGSGGTITGLSRYFARVAPQVEMVLADPVGSVLADYVEHRQDRRSRLVARRRHRRGFHSADRRPVARAARLHDHRRESLTTARELLRSEGILAGSSSGTLVAAALRYCREQTRPRPSSRSSATRATSTCRRCSTTTGWTTRAWRPADVRRPARPDRAALARGRGGQRRAGRAADDRLHADAAVRRLAAAGARRRPHRRHRRRIAICCWPSCATRDAFESPVRQVHDGQAANGRSPRRRSTTCCRSSTPAAWRSWPTKTAFTA